MSAIELPSPMVVRAYPADFTIVTGLKITIYTPRNSASGPVAHEEGHRSIAEQY